MRTCSAPLPNSGGDYCRGRDQTSAPCTGGMCRISGGPTLPHPHSDGKRKKNLEETGSKTS